MIIHLFKREKTHLMKRCMLANANPVNFQRQFSPCEKASGFLSPLISSLYKSKQFLKTSLLILVVACFQFNAFSQHAGEQEAAFRKVLTERSAKIVNTLSLDTDKYQKVLTTLVDQYLAVNAIHDEAKKTIEGIKISGFPKEEADPLIKKQEAERTAKLAKLHSAFISNLKVDLADTQIEQVKDGMTYGVLAVTWKAYQDMLPNLTAEQKEKMHGWLVEARELAMDEGSSEKKHAIFGKYKGRINNYLSAAGYDIKKESNDWQARLKEQNKKTN